jgi:hypothetical protein
VGGNDDLAAIWRWFGERHFRGESPIYERIATAVAADEEVLTLLRQAPPAAHLPLAPLAAAGSLLLDGLDHPLGDVYRGRSHADAGPLFLDLCRRHRDSLLAILQTRRVQTNDCGRSALIAPALTWATRQTPGPYWLIDVGASAGINLLCDRYRLDYGEHGATGPPDSPVQISCAVTAGDPPIADRVPDLVGRVGIDVSPIDLSDPADARWLLACVWPDSGRTDRVEASIALVQQHPPRLIAGRATDALPSVLGELPAHGTAIVMTTWAFSYFSTDERAEFIELLRTESDLRSVVWLCCETAGVVDVFDRLDEQGPPGHHLLGAMVIERGTATPHLLAHVHPHGNWLDWRARPVHPPSPAPDL